MNDVNRFSVLDWIGVWFAGLSGLTLCVFPFLITPNFARMFADFATTLPFATRLVLATWVTPIAGVSVLSALAVAVSRRSRALAFVAFVWGSLWIAGALVALYLPIFALAGSIESSMNDRLQPEPPSIVAGLLASPVPLQ